MPYTNVVVGSDGSATAERAVSQAAALAAADGARLIIVTAYTPGASGVDEMEADSVPEDIRFALSDRVQAEELGARGREVALAQGAKGVILEATEGEPADVLLAGAKEHHADLIVVGSRGLTSHAHFILGSVAASVAHHAPCDVLVAHTTS